MWKYWLLLRYQKSLVLHKFSLHFWYILNSPPIQTFSNWSAKLLVVSTPDPRFQPSDNLASTSLHFEVYKINTDRYQYPNDLRSFWIKFEPDLLWGPTRERRRWWPSGLRWFRATERPATCRCRSASIRKLGKYKNTMSETKGTKSIIRLQLLQNQPVVPLKNPLNLT